MSKFFWRIQANFDYRGKGIDSRPWPTVAVWHSSRCHSANERCCPAFGSVISIRIGDRFLTGIPSPYETSQLGQLSLASLQVVKSSSSFAGVKAAGWHVTLCDPMRVLVALRLAANCYDTFTHLLANLQIQTSDSMAHTGHTWRIRCIVRCGGCDASSGYLHCSIFTCVMLS